MSSTDTKPYCKPCTQEGSSILVIRAVNDTYNERLKAILAGTNTDFRPLDVGCPHKCLLDCNLPNLPIQISVKILTGKSSQSNHPFKFSDIVHLPEYVCKPIAVFRSATSTDDTKVVLTEMEAEGVNIVVVIRPNQEYKGVLVNDIRSLYPKNNIKPILEWICVHDLMEYCNKEKILSWLSKHQYIPDEVTKLIKDCTKLVNSM